MNGLWADGWFYISSAGLLVSGTLFFFLLGQYRAASEAADVTEAEQGADKEAAAPAAIRPVYIPETAPASQVASHSEPKVSDEKPSEAKPEPKPEPKPKMEAEAGGPERRRDAANATGGLSPAVVYLQNIKSELTELHKEMNALAKRVDDRLAAGSSRDEALIERLGDLARVVESMKAAPVEPAPNPSPKKARKVEPVPEPVPEPAPAPVPEPEPVVLTFSTPEPAQASVPEPEPKARPVSPDETIRLELGALISPPAPQVPPPPAQEKEPAPASQEPPPEEKPRRGPVWPV